MCCPQKTVQREEASGTSFGVVAGSGGGGADTSLAKLGGVLGFLRLLASVPYAWRRGLFPENREPGDTRPGDMARLRSGVGVGAFLRKQDPVPWHGNGPPSGEKCGRVKKAAGPDINALQSPQSLQGSWVGRASEERWADEPREARAAWAGVWPAWREGGARRAGGRQGSQDDAQNGAGTGRQGGRRKSWWPP